MGRVLADDRMGELQDTHLKEREVRPRGGTVG